MKSYCYNDQFKKKVQPKVGMHCSVSFYSDVEPAQIVKISPSGKTIWIRFNRCEPAKKDLEIGHQEWKIFENEFTKQDMVRVNLNKDGTYRTSGTRNFVNLGEWHKYYDWGF